MDVTINKAKTILSTLVQQQLNGNNPPPVCLWGPPGVGKSDILRQIKSEKNIDLIDIRLSQMESVDLRGVPYVEKTVEEILTKWAVPSIFPQGLFRPSSPRDRLQKGSFSLTKYRRQTLQFRRRPTSCFWIASVVDTRSRLMYTSAQQETVPRITPSRTRCPAR